MNGDEIRITENDLQRELVRARADAIRQLRDQIPHTIDPRGWVKRWMTDVADTLDPPSGTVKEPYDQ